MKVVASLEEKERHYEVIFRFMEEHPQADFGAPGPIVHAMEELGGYEEALAESIMRRPIPHTLWMVSRILNSDLAPAERQRWLGELRRVATDPNASADARAEASELLEHQTQG